MFFGGFLLFGLAAILFLTFHKAEKSTEIEDTAAAVAASQDPKFGAVYKEVKLKWPNDNVSWRVTNPLCGDSRCNNFLPNKVLEFQKLSYVSEPYADNAITQSDLGNDVEKVEMLLDRWSGHMNNLNEKFNVNMPAAGDSPTAYKYSIPDVPTLPNENKNRYFHQDNPVITINKQDLKVGNNTLQGYTGNGTQKNWMQWGWTAAVLRVYFNPETKQHVTAQIDVPTSFADNPTVKLSNISLPPGVAISKVDYIGYYEGVDVDGDGYTTDWHESYFSPKQSTAAGSFEIAGHIGTSTSGNGFPVIWDTRYVPDQTANSIKIMARIKGSNGLWYITQPKTGLSLVRQGSSVKIYHAQNVPEKYGSRQNNLNDVVRVRIPAGINVSEASEAVMFWRTWNGHNYDWGYNNYTAKFSAANHAFHQSYYNIPKSALVAGNGANDGKVWIRANTTEHEIEVQWPGPALVVRYGTVVIPPTPTVTVGASVTPSPTITSTIPVSPQFSPTPTVSPSVTTTPPTATSTVVPTATGAVGTLIACGAGDIDGNGRFTIADFIAFAGVYRRECNDSSQNFGPCGGKDADKNNKIDINDFVSFAQRYYPRESCSLN